MRKIGNIYEEKAVNYLRLKGYEIIDRNVYVGHKEIDILCIKDEVTIFLEVKYTKSKDFYFFPSLHKKKLHIHKCADFIFQSEKYILPSFWRIDLIYFRHEEIIHFTNI